MDILYTNNALSRGMTLVESVVFVAIFSLIMVTLAGSVAYFYRVNAYTIAQAYQIDYARRGLQSFTRDVREMTYADNGAFPLVVAEAHRLGFYTDIDRDNSVEYIEYAFTNGSTTLQKNVYNATGTPLVYDTNNPDNTYILSEYIQNDLYSTSTFYYFDALGTMVTSTDDIAEITYVQAQLIVNVDPVRDPGEYLMRQSAAIRNLY